MKLKDYFPLLSEKKILLSELGIHPRVYSAWKDADLIFNNDTPNDSIEKPEKRKWVSLDVFESLWLLMIVELRKLNLDLKTIKKLKEFLKDRPDFKKGLSAYSNAEWKNILSNNMTPEILDITGGISLVESFVESLSASTSELEEHPFFSNLATVLNSVFIVKASPSIIIKLNSEDNDFDFHLSFNNMSTPAGKESLYQFYSENCSNATFINLPIISIVEKLFEKEHLMNHCTDYGFYTKQERQLFDSIRNKECEEIQIVKHQSGDFTVKFSDNKDVSGEDAKMIRKTLGLKMYDRIEVIYRNDSHLVIKNTNKIVIKKD